MRRSEAEVRDAYPELLETEDPGLVRLTQLLDAGYGMHAAPASIREGPFAATVPEDATRPTARQRGPRHWRLWAPASAALGLAILGVALAVTSTTNLGKPINIQSTNQYFPLSGFHRIGKATFKNHRAQVLFIGTLSGFDSNSAVERWPVVKALQQFGSLSNVHTVNSDCHGGVLGPGGCTVPTFDWSRARYRSRFVAFEHKDLLALNARQFQRISGRDLALYNRYARIPGGHIKGDPHYVVNTVLKSSFSGGTSRGLPLIAVGGYVQTQSQVLTPGDFQIAGTPTTNSGSQSSPLLAVLSFSAAHNLLVSGKESAVFRLVRDVNSEANIITALICHADGKRPGPVCNRPAIKAILKHVK